MNKEEQKEITYKEIINLMNLIPFKFHNGETFQKLKEVRDILNSEVWLK